jgi:uncharacterized membrane protein
MPIDHFRDFFLKNIIVSNDMLSLPAGLYIFRSISIWGAIAFNFTAGMSIAFVMQKNNFFKTNRIELARRGLILIMLDTLFVFPVFFGKIGILIMTLSSLGVSMIVLAFVIPYGKKFILFLAAGLILFNNLLPFLPVIDGLLYALNHQGNFSFFNLEIRVVYPVLPWIAVMLFGYLLGLSVTENQGLVKKHVFLSILILIGFLILRYTNIIGEHMPWNIYESPLMTIKSFFNLSKYPPSLDAFLLYGSIIILIMYFFQKMPGLTFIHRKLAVFAQVPMFIYLYHIGIGALLAKIWFASGFPVLSNGVTALAALIFMFINIPVFKWYWQFKQSHKNSFLKYI